MKMFALVLFAVFCVAVVVGGIVAFVALRKAQDGFEDDRGFHPTNGIKPK
jgi:hypothetical protein